MSKAFASIQRGLKHAIRHRKGKRVPGLKTRVVTAYVGGRHRDKIKTKRQYRRYLEEVDRLVALDPDPRTEDGARLELLAKLIEDYEKEHFNIR